MTISQMVVGFGGPVLAAPFAAWGLRHTFRFFLQEGAELFGGVALGRADAVSVGSLMAKINVVILLVAWLALFTCHCLHQVGMLIAMVGIGGLTAALLMTVFIVRLNIEVQGPTRWMVGLIAFAGGNLPVFVVVAMAMVII
ncbi:MAG: hypothetical protein IH888_01540 [Planctomycetes bacterium]|nr:hypothetical protein [Planctomycetota bacterium]